MKNLLVLLCFVLAISSCSKEDVTPPPPPPENTIPAPFTALKGIFAGQGVGAAMNIGDDIILFFSADGQQYAWFEDQEIKKTERLDKEGGLFDGLAFSAVSAAIDYEEERLIFVNKVGGTYQWADINPDIVKGGFTNDTLISFKNSSFSMWEWGVDNSCPFDEVGAMFGFSKEPRGCATIGDDDDFLWMASKDGSAVSRYVKETTLFDESVDLETWRFENVCGGSPTVFPLNTLGAACIYEPEGEDLRELYFSNDGLSLTILNTKQGVYSEVYDLK